MDEIFDNISIDCPATKMDDLIMQEQSFAQMVASRIEVPYSIYFQDEYVELSGQAKTLMGFEIECDLYLYFLNFSSN